jgi:hypothetical protein
MTKAAKIAKLEAEIEILKRKADTRVWFERYFGAVERGTLRTVVTHEVQCGPKENRETIVGRIVSIDGDREHDLLVLSLAECPMAMPSLYGLDDFIESVSDDAAGHYGAGLRVLRDRVKRHLEGKEVKAA